jgi:hypothetical protein
MKSTVQKEIDQIDKDKRNEVKARIKALGVSVNYLVMESQLTSIPNYLSGKKIHSGTLFILERTLTRLEAEKDI